MQPMAVSMRLVFAVAALILFILAGLGVPQHPRFQYIGWGLAFLVLAFFLFVTH